MEHDEKQIRIEWGSGPKPRGVMVINLKHFFPATQKDITKVHKAVQEMYWDRGWDVEPIWPQVREWIMEEIPLCEVEAKKWAKEYMDARQDIADTKERIRSGKEPNGVPIPDTKINALNFYVAETQKNAAGYKRNYEAMCKRKKRLETNLRFIANWHE